MNKNNIYGFYYLYNDKRIEIRIILNDSKLNESINNFIDENKPRFKKLKDYLRPQLNDRLIKILLTDYKDKQAIKTALDNMNLNEIKNKLNFDIDYIETL